MCFLCCATHETTYNIMCGTRIVGRLGRFCAARFEYAQAMCTFEQALVQKWGKGAAQPERLDRLNAWLYAYYRAADKAHTELFKMHESMATRRRDDDDDDDDE
jgi:hypothetical protein